MATITGTSGSDRLIGTQGSDRIFGLGGDDRILADLIPVDDLGGGD